MTPSHSLFPAKPLPSAILAIFLNLIFAVASVLFGTLVLGDYGILLFLVLPFVLGLTTTFLHGLAGPRGFLQFFAIGMITLALLFLALILLPIEGAGCLLMAAPLWIGCTSAGLGIGFAIHYAYWSPHAAARGFPVITLLLMAMVPLFMGEESLTHGQPPLVAVTTSVDIDAPPEVVWQHVLAFTPLAKPDDWVYRLGAAYPIQAHIIGRGPGAVRHCVFSTGAFVEPITTWDENSRLEFDVTQSPPSMREWSPYENLHPPHLQGYLVSRHGQFLLTPLPGNRTRLTGTTWYQLHMSPNAYWRLWSDAIIHHIHGNVLMHIKNLSEQSAMPSGASPG